MQALINPVVLTWAREQSGLLLEEIAKTMRVPSATISKWEAGQVTMSLSQLEKIATLYQRPTAFFYLPHPPQLPSTPRDLRTIGSLDHEYFGKQVQLALRRAREVQNAVEGTGIREKAAHFTPPIAVDLDSDPEDAAQRLRSELGFTLQLQRRANKASGLFGVLRSAFEGDGLFVLRCPMPISEVRGFSLWSDRLPSVITVNTHDAIAGQLFTLTHEYCHLLLRDGGVCDMHGQRSSDSFPARLEVFCNRFAAEFLLPRAALSESISSYGIPVAEWSDEDYRSVADSFRISRDVVLRRMADLGFVSKTFYKETAERWQKEASKADKIKSKPLLISQDTLATSRNGKSFSRLVLEGVQSARITYVEASRLLNLKPRHFSKLEGSLREKRV